MSKPPLPAMIRRSGAARILGVTRTTIQRWEKEGKLHAVIDKDGVHRFRDDEIDKLRAERIGKRKPNIGGRPPRKTPIETVRRRNPLAAKVVQAIGKYGDNLGAVIAATGADPQYIRELYRELLVGLSEGVKEEERKAALEREREEAREHERRAHAERMLAARMKLARLRIDEVEALARVAPAAREEYAVRLIARSAPVEAAPTSKENTQ